MRPSKPTRQTHPPLRVDRLILVGLAAAVSLLLGYGTRAQIPCRYEVSAIIQAPPCQFTGPPPTAGTAISPNGLFVCGFWQHCSITGYDRAFVYRTDTHQFMTLPLPPGTSSSFAWDVTDDGLIVGSAGGNAPLSTGFIYNLGTGHYTLLTAPISNAPCEITAINSSGAVCGTRAIGGSPALWLTSAFTWSALNGFTDLGLVNNESTSAADLNDAGAVCGTLVIDGVTHPFLWQDATVTDLGTLWGYNTRPFSLNQTNEVVGYSSLGGPLGQGPRAFLWLEGTMVDLGTLPGHDLSQGLAIGGDGTVGGLSRTINGGDWGVLWRSGAVVNLNALVPPSYFIGGVAGFAATGAIVTGGYYQGRNVGLVLTPVFAPPSDITADCRVNVDDLLLVINEWGQTKSIADINQDGTVNVSDLILVIQDWTFN